MGIWPVDAPIIASFFFISYCSFNGYTSVTLLVDNGDVVSGGCDKAVEFVAGIKTQKDGAQ